MEVLRVYPAVPLGLPHKLVGDIELQGFFSPEGSSPLGKSPFNSTQSNNMGRRCWGIQTGEVFK